MNNSTNGTDSVIGIYSVDGRLNRKFLVTTKALLESLAGLAIELGQVVPLKLDNPGYGVPRMSASLHLLYHQVCYHACRQSNVCGRETD